MALRYQPHPGTLLMCDFNTGFTPPEMTNVDWIAELVQARDPKPGPRGPYRKRQASR